jgi:hypothetical protein
MVFPWFSLGFPRAFVYHASEFQANAVACDRSRSTRLQGVFNGVHRLSACCKFCRNPPERSFGLGGRASSSKQRKEKLWIFYIYNIMYIYNVTYII